MGPRASTALSGDVNQPRVHTGFPGQVREDSVQSWGKTEAGLSVQGPPYIGRLDELCSSPCALVGFPGQIGRRLYSAMSRATNEIPCLGVTGDTSLNLVKVFVSLTQASLHPEFPNPSWPRALLCKQLALPTCQLECHRATQSRGVISSPSGQMGLGDSSWGYDSAPLLGR